mmetsp:Transcript_24018/g.55753  ORF Transcript_24018/g.55753 Transcript_24018/m.55753 type:complete len:338 (+) Transcript_24018:41-1054(+)
MIHEESPYMDGFATPSMSSPTISSRTSPASFTASPLALARRAAERIKSACDIGHKHDLSEDVEAGGVLDAEDEQQFGDDVGIGLALCQIRGPQGPVIVQSVLPDSPAFYSGRIRRGDTIEQIFGNSVVGLSLSEVHKMVLGPPGTQLTLGVRDRQGVFDTVEVSRSSVHKSLPKKEGLLSYRLHQPRALLKKKKKKAAVWVEIDVDTMEFRVSEHHPTGDRSPPFLKLDLRLLCVGVDSDAKRRFCFSLQQAPDKTQYDFHATSVEELFQWTNALDDAIELMRQRRAVMKMHQSMSAEHRRSRSNSDARSSVGSVQSSPQRHPVMTMHNLDASELLL